MIHIDYEVAPDGVTFRPSPPETGLLKRYRRGPAPVPEVDDWVGNDLARCSALAALRRFGDEHPGSVDVGSTEIRASHRAVASLTAIQAQALGLPERPPLALKVDVKGVIGSPSFRLEARWWHRGRPMVAQRQGAFLRSETGDFLIPEPMFSAVVLADSFDGAAADLPGHWEGLSRFRRLFDDAPAGDMVEMTSFLEGTRIFTAEALTLQIRNGSDGIEFDPVLFDAATLDEAAENGRPLGDADGVLPEDLQRRFQSDRRTGFAAFPSAKRSYLLGSNTYLVVDDDLEAGLEVVREKQQGSPEERRGFAANPRAAISERLAERMRAEDPGANAEDLTEAIEERSARLFIETPEYAQRAVDIGIWQQPSLDFLPSPANTWWPENFAVEIGGLWVELSPSTATDLQKLLAEAIAAGKPTIEYQEAEIPATPEVQQQLVQQLQQLDQAARKDGKTLSDELQQESRRGSWVTELRENFDEKEWQPQIPQRAPIAFDVEWPSRIKSQPFTHQLTCFRWQAASWAAGLPGVLNADDQGLGKTLETLAFLAWLQDELDHESYSSQLYRRGPLLVVAPTGLLRTWEAEVEQHLGIRGLYAPHRIYGHHLKENRRPGLTGVDTDDGRCRLQFDRIESAVHEGRGHRHWLLTTYQTLTNYQHSFRQLYFSAVVFDEIQMIKNPATLRAVAAKALKAEFRVGLTGTPIENQTADLWAVLDALAPGRLDSLRDFNARYGEATEECMHELHARVFEPQRTPNGDELPPLAMRRLKEDEIDGLPRKSYRQYRETMPTQQAEAYEDALLLLRGGGAGAALKCLHRIRAVSLHPADPKSTTGTTESFVEDSARLITVANLLDELKRSGERVLLFIEDLDMQAFIAQWIRSRYGLHKVPIINGSTPVSKRHEQVRQFQQHDRDSREFDVFILSPRAAGFGITLTAATHVVHVSRWWNPAVEEQCNDRIYRIGQERDVTVHLPMAIHPTHSERSFDCVLDELMQRKRTLARSALWPPVDADSDIHRIMKGLVGDEPS